MDCVLKSFCFAADIDTEVMLRYLGHNGREVVCPELPEPYCYRAFDVHEMSRVLFDFGLSVTTIQKYDVVYNSMMLRPMFLTSKGDRIAPYLNVPRYCLANANHMIGVRDGSVLDLTHTVTRPQDFNYQSMYIINSRYDYS